MRPHRSVTRQHEGRFGTIEGGPLGTLNPMDLGIAGKVAMVAASSQGIGLATAKLLAAEGARLSICARREDVLEQAAAEISEATGAEVRSYVVDVTDPDDLAFWVDETRRDLGAPGILVTNTGGPPAGAWTSLTDSQWQSGFESTLLNVVRLVRLVAPEMQAAGWGRIVHVTSLVAKEPNAMLPISSTLRAGISALVGLQAKELALHGITVNSVLPGNTLTDRQRHLAEIRAESEGITPDEALARAGAAVPVGRLGRPEEIAAAIAFLCSEPASFVSGANLLVDGAFTRGIA